MLTKGEVAKQNLDEIFSPEQWVYGDDERLDVKCDAAPEKAKADPMMSRFCNVGYMEKLCT
jgi:hypothetical protein